MKKMISFVFFPFLFSILSAQPFPDDSCMIRHPKMRGWKELNLSKDQKEKLKELHKEMDAFRKTHIDSIRGIRAQIKEELLKDEPSFAALEKYASVLGDFHKNMTMKRFEHLLKVKSILTKEQFEKLVSLEERELEIMGGPFRRPPPPYCPYKKGGERKERGKDKCPLDDE